MIKYTNLLIIMEFHQLFNLKFCHRIFTSKILLKWIKPN